VEGGGGVSHAVCFSSTINHYDASQQTYVPVAYGGNNNTSGPIDIATACNAHGSRRYDFESETFVAAIGVDSEQNADEEMIGAIRSHQSGGSELFVAAPLGSGDHGPRYDLDNDTHVFQPRYYTRDNKPGGQPSETADITNCHKAGDSAPHVIAYKKRGGFGVSETGDIAGTLESEGGSHQGGPERTPMIAFGQNVRDELQIRGGDGQLSGALSSEPGMHQQTFVAFQPRYARNGRGAPDTIAAPLAAEAGRTGKGDSAQCVAFTERTRADGRNLETQDELTYALTNPGDGGRTQERRIAGTWGVRRLTPTECERLQGFPDGWTAVLGEPGYPRGRGDPRLSALPILSGLRRGSFGR